jgi:hypothetical protein
LHDHGSKRRGSSYSRVAAERRDWTAVLTEISE